MNHEEVVTELNSAKDALTSVQATVSKISNESTLLLAKVEALESAADGEVSDDVAALIADVKGLALSVKASTESVDALVPDVTTPTGDDTVSGV